MTARYDLERRIDDYYASEAPSVAPNWLLDQTLAAIETTRQRRAPVRATWLPTVHLSRTSNVIAVTLVAILAILLTVLAVGASRKPEAVFWSPERLVQDWPAPVRSEPGSAPVVLAMRHGDNTHWDEGGWEGLEFPDPMGDVPTDLPWLDIVEVGLSPRGTPSFGLTLAGEGLRPIANPTARWIAYGVVLDTDDDGAADVRIGIDNLPTGDHRAWRTDLTTGQTLSKAGPPYAAVGQAQGARVGLDTYYPGDTDGRGNKALFWYSRQLDEQDFRFYAWASLIEDGRVVATDYAPDVGWLEEGPQPGLPLVGTIWTEEAELSGDAASGAPDSGGILIVASLEFTADGRVVVDSGCSTGSGTVTLESGALRISDLSLTEPTCSRTDTAAFDARMRAFLSANEYTYTIESGFLELTAGPDTHRLRGAHEGPPG